MPRVSTRCPSTSWSRRWSRIERAMPGDRDRLIEGSRLLGVTLLPARAEQLLRLLDELAKWNRTHNLTAITDRDEMITHHLLDSLSVSAELRGDTVADVGTGAGFPGLPLAVVNPQ